MLTSAAIIAAAVASFEMAFMIVPSIWAEDPVAIARYSQIRHAYAQLFYGT
jgi:hypothetical protein